MAKTDGFVSFREALLEWHHEHPRPLPWKETDDPYKIWLSEIILQQTQVVQGVPYYEHFVKKYPTVSDLASASEAEVLKDWQGLGYNSRARNLRKAAIMVCEDHSGYFPSTYDDIITLSGVGPYTAAAIASFAFGESVPVIDANVIRILCRYLGIEEIPTSRAVRTQMKLVLDEAMAGEDPAVFNQAIMNFGGLQCVPKSPDCSVCPLNECCFAYQTGRVKEFPKSKKRKPRKERYFHYLVINSPKGVIIRKRKGKDIWEGMHDFPLREHKSADILGEEVLNGWASDIIGTASFEFGDVALDTQLLTHQKINCVFYPCLVEKMPKMPSSVDNFFVDFRNLHKFALPKIIDCYFRVKSILL
jgi:A/G-specific adenine glycosylase